LVFHHGDKEIPANKIYDYLRPIQNEIRDRIKAQYNGAGFNITYLGNINDSFTPPANDGVIDWDGLIAIRFNPPTHVGPDDEL
ncbi:hypothetical protein, partial [Streptococcus sp. DD13]|uniref:hypothetical protein n=1 Tax=Streptococcus sp. DD13 TaxID=1777881 RepID=UPI0018D2AE82